MFCRSKMTMDVKASQVAASTATKSSANVGASASTGGQECAGCGKHITDRYVTLPTYIVKWFRDDIIFNFYKQSAIICSYLRSNNDIAWYTNVGCDIKRSTSSMNIVHILWVFFYFLTDFCWRRWICFGTKTVWCVVAAVVGWAKSDRRCTPRRTWYCAKRITSGINGGHVAHRMMLLLIDRFYRMFGNKGMCAACFKDIPAFEMVMRARSNVYHLECFACQQCNHR